MLLTFGLILFIFVIGLFLICAAYAIPVTARNSSLLFVFSATRSEEIHTVCVTSEACRAPRWEDQRSQ